MQHQARLSGDLFSSCFEQDEYNDLNSFIRERKEQKDNKKDHDLEGDLKNTPNSLAEWSRSIDAEKLTQKRHEIHRQKRVGKKKSTYDTSSTVSTSSTGYNKNKSNNVYGNNRGNAENPAVTKE